MKDYRNYRESVITGANITFRSIALIGFIGGEMSKYRALYEEHEDGLKLSSHFYGAMIDWHKASEYIFERIVDGFTALRHQVERAKLPSGNQIENTIANLMTDTFVTIKNLYSLTISSDPKYYVPITSSEAMWLRDRMDMLLTIYAFLVDRYPEFELSYDEVEFLSVLAYWSPVDYDSLKPIRYIQRVNEENSIF